MSSMGLGQEVVRPILFSAWAVCGCCSPSHTPGPHTNPTRQDLYPFGETGAHIFKPRKWQSRVQTWFLQLGGPHPPGHRLCPSLFPQRNPPSSREAAVLGRGYKVIMPPNLLVVFSQEPLVWRRES